MVHILRDLDNVVWTALTVLLAIIVIAFVGFLFLAAI